MTTHKITNYKSFRTNVCAKLTNILENPKDASNLEKGIHNWSLKEATNRKIIKKWDNDYFVRLYLDHLRSVYINLKNNNSLIEQVNTGTLKPHKIAFMTHQEMDYKRWEMLIKAKSIRDMNKFEQEQEANTDTYTCRKCKSNKCNYYQQQVRAADEPMTIFINCTKCGNRWKN